MRVRVDQDEARRLGLSSAALAAVLNAAVTGSTVTQVRDDIYLIDVVARATGEERISLPTLRTLQVPLPNGRTVALDQFATFEYEQEYPLVWRRDRVPTLTVRADVAPGVLPESVVTELAPAIAELNAGLPQGYQIELGGIAEESAKSRASVFAVVPVMLLIMLTVLMFHLQSFQRLFMVLAILPLGLIGVVARAARAFGRPLGFVAILGILALIGMIAKNAVILITQIEADRAEGRDVWDAVVSASQLASAADVADRDLDRARPDPDRAHGVLGAHGVRHHGRAPGRDHADPDLGAEVLAQPPGQPVRVLGRRRIDVGQADQRHALRSSRARFLPVTASCGIGLAPRPPRRRRCASIAAAASSRALRAPMQRIAPASRAALIRRPLLVFRQLLDDADRVLGDFLDRCPIETAAQPVLLGERREPA